MRTKFLMQGSALFLLALGLMLTFAPQEVLAYGGSAPDRIPTLAAQAAGALYLGFAMLNWMAKDNLIGGIYSRPVAMGNLLHFLVMGLALLRSLGTGLRAPVVVVTAVLYAVFAVWFGAVVFGSPVKRVRFGSG